MSDNAIERWVGGSPGKRSFFGGKKNTPRMVGLLFFGILGGWLVTSVNGVGGLAIGLAGCGLTYVLTIDTHRGTVLARLTKNRSWKDRIARGTDAFEQYTPERWAEAQTLAASASGRREQFEANRMLTAIRANPDGADGLGWLQAHPRKPGIAWHGPLGETPYLSVAFAVEGQLHGLEPVSVMNRGSEAWGKFLAANAGADKFVDGVQTLTRVLPVDIARQMAWVAEHADPLPEDAPDEATDRQRRTLLEAQHSYAEVIRRCATGAMGQRHFVIVRWPITPAFVAEASKYAEGEGPDHERDGWRRFMDAEIRSVQRSLRAARLGAVSPLTAQQVCAFMLHAQDPSRPLDQISDVDVSAFGLSSHDERSAYVVDTEQQQWWHRTAAITAEGLAAGSRDALWVLDVLIGMDSPVMRSVAFHHGLIPKAQAAATAKSDLLNDAANSVARNKKGRVDLGEGELAMNESQIRVDDLKPGRSHQGDSWIAYVTISATSRDELARFSREFGEVARSGLGAEQIQWCDTYQSTAAGYTWPLCRGLSPERKTLLTAGYSLIAGKSRKDEL